MADGSPLASLGPDVEGSLLAATGVGAVVLAAVAAVRFALPAVGGASGSETGGSGG